MRSTQISKTVLSNTLLILPRRQSFFHRCRTNRPRVSVYLRNQRRFEEIIRNSAMIQSTFEWASTPFKPVWLIPSPFMAKRNTRLPSWLIWKRWRILKRTPVTHLSNNYCENCYKCCYQTPYSEDHAANNISHANRDDWHFQVLIRLLIRDH